jgi:hypothetical protein
MTTSHRILAALAALATLALGVTPAFAMPAPPPDGGGVLPPAEPITVQHVTDGSPIWLFVVVALATAIVSATAAILAMRLRQPKLA